MSDPKKDDAPGELDDEQLSDVSGGAGIVPETGLMEEEGIGSPAASGLPTGKRMHKPFVMW